MSTFTPAETAACERLIELALDEDLGTAGDLTSLAVIPANLKGKAQFVARSSGVLAGLPAAKLVLSRVARRYEPLLAPPTFESCKEDGQAVEPGTTLARVQGSMRTLLMAERTALNFLQRLSGVASQARHHVDALAGLPCRILDTRKTTPGWRLLEKYAVRCGGAHNHRLGLWDGVLIKDNHLASLWQQPDPISAAVHAARARWGRLVPLEIEVDTLEQFDRALSCAPDIVLLDNMPLEQLREAVRRRNTTAPGVRLEASGGVNLATVRGIAETGVDCISVGALTHSAPALDIALDYLK